jgi:2-dehydro-3-deoxy-D-arabinonate dehydratase
VLKLYRTAIGPVVERNEAFVRLPDDWDTLVNRDDLLAYLHAAPGRGEPRLGHPPLAPIGRQEVMAAGVTYTRSRTARMEEQREASGGSFYDRVYTADRPELFFKSAGWRVRGHDEAVRIRRDATWSVPEPEIALYVNADGHVIGYTIGNDMSSRDIEGENPLYLPQAKIYDGGCALGPALYVTDAPLPPSTVIELIIVRDGGSVFEGRTTYSNMRRPEASLVDYLYRETRFPDGCVLLTGTGVVPDDSFRLRAGDEIRIHVPPIGTLRNTVEDAR